MYKDDLKKYLDDLAAKLPAPGGGSAAALTAAIGVALISMVANFTVGKEKYKAFEDEAKEVLSSSETLRERFIALVDEDVTAYKKLSSAYKLRKSNCADKKKREEAIQVGLKEALATPLEICKCCHQAIKLCPGLVEKGNVNLISDVGVAAALLEAAFQSALLNVDINLKSIKDSEFILGIRKVTEPMDKEVSTINQEVNAEVKKYLVK